MSERRRIYLDNAATGWPKPEAVYEAVLEEMRDRGVAAGRGAYADARAAGEVIGQCRRLIARRIGAAESDAVVLAHSGTHALNLAIHGLLRPGDHVVTTAAEHNSVLRPLWTAQEQGGVQVEIAPCDALGRVDPRDVLARVRDSTRLVALTHGSNVTGALQPLEAITQGLRGHDALILCDAAQTLGYHPLELDRLGADLLAAPGHKGLCGPLGTGVLIVRQRAASEIRPWMQGGTGSLSDQRGMPAELPERLEPGNVNVPALAGWNAGLRWLEEQDLEAIADRGRRQSARIAEGLSDVAGLRVIAAGDLPIVSLTLETLDPHAAAMALDAEFGVQVRSGLHCAPLIHPYLGTAPAGTLRISPGHLTDEAQIDAGIEAVRELAAAIEWGPA